MSTNRSDVIDYRIEGDDMQAVVITLDPSEVVIAEAGMITNKPFCHRQQKCSLVK